MGWSHTPFLSSACPRIRLQVAAALKGLEVGVLVNNVGQSYNFPMYFDELSDEQARTHTTEHLILLCSTLY